MEEEKKSHHFLKKVKQYTAIFLGIVPLFFLRGETQKKQDTHPDEVKIIQSVNTTISERKLKEKIDFLVDNMLESDATSIPTSSVELRKWNPSTSRITSQIKKDFIRENFLKYTSTPEGRKLLAMLDITKIQFIDMPNLHDLAKKSGSKEVTTGLHTGKGIFADFDDLKNLPDVHHEFTHVLQHQTNSCTKSGKLCELEAHLNEIKFTDQATQQGILKTEDLDKDLQDKLFNYQKYNRDDAKFILNYLNPKLVWMHSYREQFLLRSDKNTPKQLFQYARQLGLSGRQAKTFIRELTKNDEIRQISYEIDKQGNETKVEKIGHPLWGAETMTLTCVKDGTLTTFQYKNASGSWKKVKEHYEKGDCINEYLFDLNGFETEKIEIKGNTKKQTIFGADMGARIETIDFVDKNNNQCQTVTNNMHPDFKGEIVQNFVNGKLVKETKTSFDGVTKTTEFKKGKWLHHSLKQRLQGGSNQQNMTPPENSER